MFKQLTINTDILIPLSAKYDYDGTISFDPTLINWSDGYSTFQHPIFKGSRDISFNKDSFFVLTSTFNLSSIFESNVYNTVDTGGFTYFKFLSTNNFITESNGVLMASSVSSEEDGFFRLAINADDTVSLIKGGKYFTVDRTAPWTIRLSSLIIDDVYSQQKFNYTLDNNIITISTKVNPTFNPNIEYKRFLSYSPISYEIRAVGLAYDDDYTTTNPYFIQLINNTEFSMTLSTLSFDNLFVRHYSKLGDKLNNQNANIDFNRSISSVKLNYLVDIPYATKLDLTNKSMSINLLPLKTVQTPEYEYSLAPNISSSLIIDELNGNNLKRRDYDRIFTGSNEHEGYENIFLSYVSNTKEMIFEPDKVTYFHYPRTSPTIPLSSSGLIESGAIAGNCPFNSDKIWKKQANYASNVEWGNSSIQNGTWLCSWLSGSPSLDVKPVWKDRYFFAGYIDPSDAFVSSSSSYVYDIDSAMTFESGVYYKYHHIGNKINNRFINSLSSVSALKLHLDIWSDETIDLSPYNNIITMDGYNDGMVEKTDISLDNITSDTCLILNGENQKCRVAYSESYLPSSEFTASIWAYADDWGNVNGNHLLSKGFRGGFDIKYNTGHYTPIIAVIDNTHGHIILTNNEGKFYKNIQLPIYNNSTCNPNKVLVDRDLFIWVGDNFSKTVYKVDYNGNILDTISFASSISSYDLGSLVSDISGNICFGLSSTNNVYEYRSYNPYTLQLDTSGNISNHIFDYDIYGNMTVLVPSITSSKLSFTSNNELFFMDSMNRLSVSSSVRFGYFSDTEYSDFIVDDDNYIFATRNDCVCRLNSILETPVEDLSVIADPEWAENSGKSYISIVYQNNVKYIVVIYENTNKCYLFDENLNEKKVVFLNYAINAEKYPDYFTNLKLQPYGDFSGYEWNKKYSYFNKQSSKTIDADIYLSNDDDYPEWRGTLSVNVSSLSNYDWHHFVMTYNKSQSLFKFYVDGVLKNQISTPSKPIFYRYKNPLFVGGTTSILEDMDYELGYSQHHFKGKFDDLRIYSYELSKENVINLYNNKLKYYPLKWNMPIGNHGFIEEIERVFKNKLTGNKSQFFNIKIKGLGITDLDTKLLIEDIIKSSIKKVAPYYATLYKIIWID